MFYVLLRCCSRKSWATFSGHQSVCWLWAASSRKSTTPPRPALQLLLLLLLPQTLQPLGQQTPASCPTWTSTSSSSCCRCSAPALLESTTNSSWRTQVVKFTSWWPTCSCTSSPSSATSLLWRWKGSCSQRSLSPASLPSPDLQCSPSLLTMLRLASSHHCFCAPSTPFSRLLPRHWSWCLQLYCAGWFLASL